MSDRPNLQVLSTPASAPAVPQLFFMAPALTRYSLLSRQLEHAARNGWAAALLPLVARPQTWQELLELQQAVVQQIQQMQQGWMRGWAAWFEECAQLKRVNTMSKLVEQEFNLVAQLMFQFQGQATDWANLQENVEVNFGYWLSEQVGR